MHWKTPKNTNKYHWTAHVTEKMHYYGLSEQKVLSVIRSPRRVETGIAENTVAVMVPVGEKSLAQREKNKNKRSMFGGYQGDKPWTQEIWVMYQIKTESKKLEIEINPKNARLRELQNKINLNKKLTIISAWRFPGVSSEKDPIPAEIWREIEEMQLL
jgi:hypothetical protein